MQHEWRVWFGFIAVVTLSVMFVLGRDDVNDRSQLSAGVSVPTTTVAPSTTITTVPPTTTSSSSTVVPSTTAPPTTRRATTATTQVADTTPADTTPAPPPTAAPTTPPTTAAPIRVQFGAGTYRVGVDLPAGIYRTDGGQDCFWARLSSLSGSADSVIAGDHTEGAAATVGVEPSDAAFTTSGCAIWQSV